MAVGAVDLAEKLPWSKRYQVYSSRRIGAMDLMQATGAPVFESMFDQGQGGREDATARPAAAAAGSGGVSPSPPPATRAAAGSGGVLPNGAGAGAGVMNGTGSAGAEGALGASWGELSNGPETRVSNPLFGSAAGRSGAVVGQAPTLGGKKAALGGVPAPEVEIVEMMGQEDEGAGVFGAILHEPGVWGIGVAGGAAGAGSNPLLCWCRA